MSPTSSPTPIRVDGRDVLIDVKVVPGASRSRIMGLLADRIKVAIASAPQKGRANAELVGLLAAVCDVLPRQVSIERGATSALKTVRIREITAGRARQALLS